MAATTTAEFGAELGITVAMDRGAATTLPEDTATDYTAGRTGRGDHTAYRARGAHRGVVAVRAAVIDVPAGTSCSVIA